MFGRQVGGRIFRSMKGTGAKRCEEREIVGQWLGSLDETGGNEEDEQGKG